ncbi:Carboxymuconolactone decarboxylase family protein [Lactococcus lactis]|nr:Carboxymuconolactone decarboxylase family protein [Lactococcus lactis]
MEKQTAGHEQLGEFAPKFAELNDDILFGEVWSREKELSAHERSVITITALIAGGNFEQLNFHMAKGKENGISQEEISEIITHLSFYVGWPKAWSAFNIAKNLGIRGKDMTITVNILYQGKGDKARLFADEMVSSGLVDKIRQQSGNLRYEYFFLWIINKQYY